MHFSIKAMRHAVNVKESGSIPEGAATVIYFNVDCFPVTEEGTGSSPVITANFKPRPLGPEPAFTRQGGEVRFFDGVPCYNARTYIHTKGSDERTTARKQAQKR